jgi:hypothetical protein
MRNSAMDSLLNNRFATRNSLLMALDGVQALIALVSKGKSNGFSGKLVHFAFCRQKESRFTCFTCSRAVSGRPIKLCSPGTEKNAGTPTGARNSLKGNPPFPMQANPASDVSSSRNGMIITGIAGGNPRQFRINKEFR